MPAAARLNDGSTTGHRCSATTTLNIPSTHKVFANSRPIGVVGNPTHIHSIKVGKSCVPHVGTIGNGSGTVFIGNIKAARIGDPCDAGAIISGSSNVFIGG